MKIVLKKRNVPIKTYKSPDGSALIVMCLYVVTLVLGLLIFIAGDFGMGINISLLVLLLLGFSFLFYFFTWEFDVYKTHFTVCSSFIFLPLKIIFTEIYFDTIDWIDYGKFNGTAGSARNITIFEINIYFKNGKYKKYSFLGKESELIDFVNNWRNLSGTGKKII